MAESKSSGAESLETEMEAIQSELKAMRELMEKGLSALNRCVALLILFWLLIILGIIGNYAFLG